MYVFGSSSPFQEYEGINTDLYSALEKQPLIMSQWAHLCAGIQN